ncbi:restriction endonuclease subunit S [Helicobacter ganmani]|uniref:restriction endonuclease subunit S n=1 Tax=Helicobacter ganmani TaxID=60246 RepID=UPI003A8AFE1F
MNKTTWKRVKLGEVAEINPLESIKKNTLAKKVSMDNLEPFNKKIYSFSMESFKGGSKFKNGDTLLARITPCLENGKTAFVDFLENNEIAFGSTEFIILREKENISDKHFLYYLARSENFRETAIKSMTGSSGRERVQIEVIRDYEFSLPPLETQHKIAEILSSLDDKIDLLHRQNKTLESLSLTLFRHTFIDNPNRNEWQIGKLGDYIEIFDNKRIPLSKLQRDKMKTGTLYPYYGAASIMDYINEFIFDDDYILMGEDGTVETENGYPILQYASGKFWVNNHAHIFKAKAPYNDFFILNFLKQTNISHIVTGAVQPKINQENLKSIPFCKYPIELVSWFIETTNAYFDKINTNKKQIQNLESLRDIMLPKLLSGEIKSLNE